MPACWARGYGFGSVSQVIAKVASLPGSATTNKLPVGVACKRALRKALHRPAGACGQFLSMYDGGGGRQLLSLLGVAGLRSDRRKRAAFVPAC